jgi:hypothetical protein
MESVEVSMESVEVSMESVVFRLQSLAEIFGLFPQLGFEPAPHTSEALAER